MSAFIVDRLHIAAIVGSVSRYSRGRIERSTEDQTAIELARENARSVNHKYRSDEDEDAPIPTTAQIEGCYRQPLSVPALLQAIACLEYQSCEHPEWADSTAARWLRQARETAISALPGYDEAPWEVRADNIERARAPLRVALTHPAQGVEATGRARVALDFLLTLGDGSREGAAAVLAELLDLEEELVSQAAARSRGR